MMEASVFPRDKSKADGLVWSHLVIDLTAGLMAGRCPGSFYSQPDFGSVEVGFAPEIADSERSKQL